MLYVCVFFVISMDMLLFSFIIIIEKVYLKNDVVSFFYMRYIMKILLNLAVFAVINVKIVNKIVFLFNYIKYYFFFFILV